MIINVKLRDTQLTKRLQVHPEAYLSHIRSILEIEFQIPAIIQYLHNAEGHLLEGDDKSLMQLGIFHESHILLSKRELHTAPPSEPNYETLAQELLDRSTPDLLASLEHTEPALASSLQRRDLNEIIEYLKEQHAKEVQKTREQQEKFQRALLDPTSSEAQEFVLQQIQQQQIDDSYYRAQEYLPESFGSIPMTYINLELNGAKLVAFIDTGAQSTIMSYACVEQSGLTHQIDRRFRGIAQGVGIGKIVGRIHLTQIKLGAKFFAASIIVLEDSKIDFLFGLDLLRRHQCILNYEKNILMIHEEQIPFLSEHEIKLYMSMKLEASELTIPQIEQNIQQIQQQQNTDSIDVQSDPKIAEMIALGVSSREEAIRLLQSTNGNIELAATIFWESQGRE